VFVGKLLLDQAQTMLDNIDQMLAPTRAQEDSDAEGDALLRVHCPGCRRSVLKGELLRTGCYVCGWTRSDAELDRPAPPSFRVACPGCGTPVVRAQFLTSGCYVCGRRLADGEEV
jgi:hypothetical protein